MRLQLFSIDTDEPRLSRSLKQRLSNAVRNKHKNESVLRVVWPFVAEAYSAGYRAGHEDQMQMRIRDAEIRASVR